MYKYVYSSGCNKRKGKGEKRGRDGRATTGWGVSDGSVDGEQQMMSVNVNEYCSHSARKLKAPPEVAIFVRAVKAAVVIPCSNSLLLCVYDWT